MNRKVTLELMRQAVGRVGNCEPRFVCPICLGSEGTPTVEHVPAKSLGGEPLTLVCEPCNNLAGRTLQLAQKRRHRVAFTTAAGPGRGTYHVSGNERVLKVDARRNSPAVFDAVFKADVPFELTDFDERRWATARIGDLRDAYLWGFALFGYSLIARPEYEWVRVALRSGSTPNSKFAVGARTLTKPNPGIWLLAEPRNALMVVNGEHGCILPTPACPDPYLTLGDETARCSTTGARPVPTTTMLLWDSAPDSLAK